MTVTRAVALRTIGTAALVAVPITTLSVLQVTYHNAALHAAFETTAALTALLAAFLILGRIWQLGLRSDVVLFVGLLVLGGANITLAFVPEVLDSSPRVTAPFSLVGAGLIALAAFVPRKRAVRPAALVLRLVVAVTLCVSTVSIIARTAPNGAPVNSVIQWTMAVIFGLAAVGFMVRYQRTGDQFMRWFASASLLAILARINYTLPPDPVPNTLNSGDLLKMGFYLLVMVGAALEIVNYWRRMADTAVLEERRRIARELHDGLAQELYYVVTRSRMAARRDESEEMTHLARAADRALAESRRAIATLTPPDGESLDASLERETAEIADRFATRVEFDLERGIRVSSDAHVALLRIAREAIANATHHGHASTINVSLSNGTGVRLRVRDDGRGFDTGLASGFGLTSMKQRAEALGGHLMVDSAPGEGTTVEAVLP